MNPKILLFTAKNPASTKVLDGGAKTVLQYIEALSCDYTIDLLHLNIDDTSTKNPCAPKGVSQVEVIDANVLDYSLLDNKGCCEKFERRVRNSLFFANEIKKRIDKYTLVVIFHCSLAMGLWNLLTAEELKKIVLLPMFLTPSYRRSGEFVSENYVRAETVALNSLSHIITPSKVEKKQLINYYKIDEWKVHEIPRSVDDRFDGGFVSKRKNKSVKVCYIASFKNQKNNIESIKCIEILLKRNFCIELFLIGSVFDKNVFQQCVDYVRIKNLQNEIHFLNAMPYDDLCSFYKNMDLAISTSVCETFGRSIFESMSYGLPTFCLDKLDVVDEFAEGNIGLKKCLNYKDMADAICSMLMNQETFLKMSFAASEIRLKLTFEKQKKMISSYFKKLLQRP